MVARPQLVWVKAANPLGGHDGTAVATLALARVWSRWFDLHLIHIDGAGAESPAQTTDPFRSVRAVRASHQGSLHRRIGFGLWYVALDIAGVRPIAQSVESCSTVRAAVAERCREVDASVVMAEHWTIGLAFPSNRTISRVLRLIDAEHIDLHERASAGTGLTALRNRRRSRLTKRAELKAASVADHVLTVSDEDQALFAGAGVSQPRCLPITMAASEAERRANHGEVVVLGRLDWRPNAEGLRWFLAEVWPVVVQHVPDARLRVVGGGSNPDQLGVGDDRVEIVGWVDDLDDELASASVGVVPVFSGTGVKMKTLKMLAAGLPVVSTSRGVRGVRVDDDAVVIANDSQAMVDGLLDLLTDAAQNERLAMRGQQSLLLHHGPELASAFALELAGGARV